MLLSDGLYELLYRNGLSPIQGFYSGQWINYALILSTTLIGFFVNYKKYTQVMAGSLAATLLFFVLSNGLVWAAGGTNVSNVPYTRDLSGLADALIAGIPFLQGGILAAVVFGTVFYVLYKFYLSTSMVNKSSIA